MSADNGQVLAEPMPSVVSVANVVYALHTIAIVIGLTCSATVIGSFIGSIPSIAAVILNYLKRGDARGTWVYSHFRWQIRTFWFTLLWFLVALALIVTVIGAVIGIPLLLVVTCWLIYRVARGWTRLQDGLEMYV